MNCTETLGTTGNVECSTIYACTLELFEGRLMFAV